MSQSGCLKDKWMLSIIIPAYNSSKTIKESLNSIWQQNPGNIEVICVDDGSSDGTVELLQQIAAEQSCLRVIQNPHGGQSRARNTGIAAAQGDYVLFMDSDDTLFANAIPAMIEQLQKKTPDMLLFGFEMVRTDGTHQEFCIPDFFGTRQEFFEERFTEAYKLFLMNAPWNKAIRRELLVQGGIRFREGMRLYEDLMFSLDVAESCETVLVDSRMFYYYNYMRPNSITNSFVAQTEQYVMWIADKLEALMKKYPLDQGYFYSDIVHKLISQSGKIRRNPNISGIGAWCLIARMFSQERVGFYLNQAQPEIQILKRQIRWLRKLWPCIRVFAFVTKGVRVHGAE